MATMEEVRKELFRISPDCSQCAWFRVAAALYSEFGRKDLSCSTNSRAAQRRSIQVEIIAASNGATANRMRPGELRLVRFQLAPCSITRSMEQAVFDINQLRLRRLDMYFNGACDCGAPFNIVVVVSANGCRQYRLCCSQCGKVCDRAILKSKLDARTLARSPIIRRNNHDCECARCGNPATELHHWAPFEVFKAEFDLWPTSYLCLDCHRRWLEMMSGYLWKGRQAAPPEK
jgi:hypothetical protein